MKRWIRRLRGVLGIGTAWGLAGTTVGAIGGLVASVAGGLPLPQLLELALGAGGFGFVLGSAFAAVLTMLEPRRTLEELSPRRAAVWGALAGAALPIAWIVVVVLPEVGANILHPRLLVAALAASGAYGVLSAALAALTVALARLAPPDLDSGPVSAPPHRLIAPGDA